MAHTYMLLLDTYESTGNVYVMPEFVNFILKENGTYLNSLLFPRAEDKMTSHNPIFAFILHTDSHDAWVTKGMNYQVTICYDLKFLDVSAGSREYVELTSIFENIMQCKVNFLAFSSFERAVGLYTGLLEMMIHQHGEFCATFRRETSSMADMHLHVVLQRVLHKNAVDDGLWRCEAERSWCDFFKDLRRLYWYHDYVMFLVGAAKRDGYSVSNVEAAAFDIRHSADANPTHEQMGTTRAKQSLLELLKKAYKYTLV
jgi:hypothetical protein